MWPHCPGQCVAGQEPDRLRHHAVSGGLGGQGGCLSPGTRQRQVDSASGSARQSGDSRDVSAPGLPGVSGAGAVYSHGNGGAGPLAAPARTTRGAPAGAAAPRNGRLQDAVCGAGGHRGTNVAGGTGVRCAAESLRGHGEDTTPAWAHRVCAESAAHRCLGGW